MKTKTYLLLVVRLELVNEKAVRPVLNLTIEISKMLTALRNRLLE